MINQHNNWEAKLDKIINNSMNNSLEDTKIFIRNRVFTFQNCVLSLLINGNNKFQLGTSHLLSKMFSMDIFTKSSTVPTKEGYNTACDKIKPEFIEDLVSESFKEEAKEKEELFHGLRVTIVDGTHVRVKRNEDTIKEFGLGSGAKGDAHYPQTESVGFYNLSTGLFEEFKSDHFTTPERKFMQDHAKNNKTKTLYLADAGYNGMAHIAIIKIINNQEILMQLKTGKIAEDFLKSKAKSKIIEVKLTGSHLISYKDHDDYESLKGKTLKVRLVRTRGTNKLKSQVLITTLLDEKKFKNRELCLLYLQRYKIELAFRCLKADIGLEMIQKEKLNRIKQNLQAGILLFNMGIMFRNSIKQNSLFPEKKGVKVYCLRFAISLVVKVIKSSFFKEDFFSIYTKSIESLKSCFNFNRPWRATERICKTPPPSFTKLTKKQKQMEIMSAEFLTQEYMILGVSYEML